MIKILCNGRQCGIGVDGKEIVLSVKTENIGNIKEVVYKLFRSEKEADGEYIEIYHGKSNEIPYSVSCDCRLLQSFSKVYCKVDVVTSDGAVFTEEDCFEIWLKKEDVVAKWIENPLFNNNVSEYTKSFEMKESIDKARLSVVGLGAFDVFFNGRKLDNCYFKPLLTDYDVRTGLNTYDYNEKNFANGKKTINLYTYSLDGLIKEGRNTLTVQVGNGFYHNVEKTFVDPSFNYGTPKLFFQIDLFAGDGRHSAIASDESCSVRNLNFKSLIYGGDYVDFSAEEKENCRCKLAAAPKAVFVSRDGISDVCREVLEPVATEKGNGYTDYDFGINHSGGLSLSIRGQRNSKVTIRYYEVKHDDGTPNYDTSKWDAYNREKVIVGSIYQSDTLILSGGVDEISPTFSYKCYRYARIEFCEPIEVLKIKSLFICANVEKDGVFCCDNGTLNRLSEFYVRTQYSNMHQGVPTDCPHREKLPYTGDGAVCAPAVMYYLDGAVFYDKWLKDIRESQGNNGIIPYSAPFIGGGGGYWYCNSIANIAVCMYRFTGDKRYLQDNIGSCFRLIDYYTSQVDKDYLIKKIDFGWCLGDWANPVVSEFCIEYMSMLSYYSIVDATLFMIDELKGEYLLKRDCLLTLRNKVKEVINANYFDRERCCYSKGIQGESLLPLVFGIVPSEYVERVKQKLFDYYASGLNDTGFIIFPQLIEYLIKEGKADIAYKMLTRSDSPSLYKMMEGETTLCEMWDKYWLDYKSGDDSAVTKGGGEVSHCHPILGAVTFVLFKYIAGLDLSELYKGKIKISPKLIRYVKSAEAEKRLNFGVASTEYRLDNGFGMKVRIPPTLKGEVTLTDLPCSVLKINGKKVVHGKNGKFEFTLESGVWEINGV